jgi:aminotransferase
MDFTRLIAHQVNVINGSGIRRVFDEASRATNPIRLHIGQPDFPVDRAAKRAAMNAIDSDLNGYSASGGLSSFVSRIARHVQWDVGWRGVDAPGTAAGGDADVLVTNGTSAALFIACMSVLNPGDELILPDPYFVAYPYFATLCNAKPVLCDTYSSGFRMTAERVEPLITPRTKAVLSVSPSNPTGTVLTRAECADLLELCRRRNVLLISDEIYDEFTFAESRSDLAAGDATAARCPSPARLPGAENDVLLVRGFGKTYGMTGWRLAYAAGPKALIAQMRKLQQYLYVCAPTPLQVGAEAALDADMRPIIESYQARRDEVLRVLSPHTSIPNPGGAFYAFVEVPKRLNMTSEQFYQRAAARNVFVVPGHAFSKRDTHFRISYATTRDELTRGLAVLAELMQR